MQFKLLLCSLLFVALFGLNQAASLANLGTRDITDNVGGSSDADLGTTTQTKSKKEGAAKALEKPGKSRKSAKKKGLLGLGLLGL
ncbi:hypothetical protein V8B55DRAFT_1161978 [Mucor lusitanicus]|uniref:Uncharacterized protein n=1 Tax=Mucor circinelloides f. lusitanicus TaxID=29924 RepID=A0A8H4BF31_MUCCL|nr:hypothetical protein FB192DRAFT_1390567 [Mucor lusitanicus]